ncbi:MAG: choice-of-anchor J domain-containing protein [Bacteroidales bacterium]|nr:choice-of-anchor J domain-containing protein [Bacteroidales bacterium]
MKRLVLTIAILAGFVLGGVAQSLHYDFEDGTLQGWTTLDGDDDGHNWEPSIGGMGHNSNGMVMAYSKDYATGEPLTPDEYLVSPRLVLNEWPVINFFVCALDEIYCAEHFGVSISTTVNDDPLAFTLLHDWTLTAKDAGNRQGNWYEFTVDLSAYTGQEVYVAIRHHYCSGQSAICVDDIQIDGTIQQGSLVVAPSTLTFEEPFVPQTFTIYNQTDAAVTISSINVEPDDNVVLLSYGGLPRTLQPNATMNVEVEVNGVGYKGYNTYHVNIATSIGNRQVTVRVNEEAWDEGLLWMPMQGLTFDENSPLTQDFYLYNTNALESITIYELYEAGTDYLALIPSHTLPYVIPPHESLNVSATLVNFPENTTNVNIYCESSLGQGSTPYIHIIGGLTPGSGELVITPDTLWVTEMYQYQNSFTILNVTDHEVVISEVYADDSIVAINHYDPAYGYIDIEDILPITLQVGEDIVLHTYLTNLVEPMAKRSEYIVAPIHIVSTEGEDEVILMIDEAAISFGLIAYLPYYRLDSYEPHQFSLVNAEWSQPITITGIEEIGTDYLEITTEAPLPVTLENYGDYLRGSLKCREPFPFHAFVSTSIIVHTSIGDFGAIGVDIDGTMLFSPIGNEWYYEIENENGSITYQYMYQAGDTIVQDEPTHILVKINTLYDKDLHQDVTHEYVYERDGKVYWWNKTLEEFTVLYDFGAQEGDSWTIKVGTETLIMHVNSVETFEYEGKTYRMLHVSDADDYFSGDIVCGIGHLTSFFPERLMNNGDGLRVEGLRCYWVEDELVFKYGDEDCDAIYDELHGIEEDGPSTGSGAAGPFTVYPNPTNGVLFVETVCTPSLPAETYHITNLVGQTVLSGNITADNQQINVSSLPQGMYFITFAGETQKFVVR